MKFILPLFLLALFVSLPVMAEEPTAGAESMPVKEEISPERLALAKKMHDIWPIRTRIESAIEGVAQNFPEEKQPEVKAALRKSIQYDEVEEQSINAMASTFTEEELKAMVDFYGSETGRSISAKTTDYEAAMRPVIVKMLDKAMLELKTGSSP